MQITTHEHPEYSKTKPSWDEGEKVTVLEKQFSLFLVSMSSFSHFNPTRAVKIDVWPDVTSDPCPLFCARVTFDK